MLLCVWLSNNGVMPPSFKIIWLNWFWLTALLLKANIIITCSELSFKLNFLRLIRWWNLTHSSVKSEYFTPWWSLPRWETDFISNEYFEYLSNNKDQLSEYFNNSNKKLVFTSISDNGFWQILLWYVISLVTLDFKDKTFAFSVFTRISVYFSVFFYEGILLCIILPFAIVSFDALLNNSFLISW